MLDIDPAWVQLGVTLPPAGETPHPTRAEAEVAVRTLTRRDGDNPAREGLAATPGRVARAGEEGFAGDRQDPSVYSAARSVTWAVMTRW